MSSRTIQQAAAVLAIALAAATATPAAAAGPVSPGSGPTSGGTVVSAPLPPLGHPVLTVADGVGMFSRSLAVGSDGKAYSWGEVEAGGLGDVDASTASGVPLVVGLPPGVSVAAASSGSGHAALLTADGQVYTWGSGGRGELGTGTTTASTAAARVPAPPGVTFTAVSAGDGFTLAEGTDGHVYGWGANDFGQLGDGTLVDRTAPVRVQSPAGVTLGLVDAGYRHAVALGSDGRAYGWGGSGTGELGTAVPTGSRTTAPTALDEPAGARFTAIDAGHGYTVATGSDGHTYAWGENGAGMLGRGTTTPTFQPNPEPVRVLAPAGVTFTRTSLSSLHVVATGSDGHLYAWGGVGETDGALPLGTGGQVGSATPARVALPTGTAAVTALAVGETHSLATTADGNTWAWGRGAALGTGAVDRAPVPVPLWPTIEVTEVAFGGVPGTGLTQDASGWTVTAPPGCGTTDVTVTYAELGTSTQTLTDAFTYGSAPTVTRHPADVVLDPGVDEVTLEAAADGDARPAVQWQQSRDGGPWSDLPGATDPTLTTRLTGDTDLRAVFTSCAGTATTGTASVVLTPAADEVPAPSAAADPLDDAPAADRLARTGAPAVATALLAAVLVGAGSLLVTRRARPGREVD